MKWLKKIAQFFEDGIACKPALDPENCETCDLTDKLYKSMGPVAW